MSKLKHFKKILLRKNSLKDVIDLLGADHMGDYISVHVTALVHGCTGEIIKIDSFKL